MMIFGMIGFLFALAFGLLKIAFTIMFVGLMFAMFFYFAAAMIPVVMIMIFLLFFFC